MKKVRCDVCKESKEKGLYTFLNNVDFIAEFGAVCSECVFKDVFVFKNLNNMNPGDVFDLSGSTYVYLQPKDSNEHFASLMRVS